MASRKPSEDQLETYKKTRSQQTVEQLKTASGAPIGNKTASLSVGPRGPVLLQDVVFVDEMAHFNRERIPERVVHAKGSGAHGYFEVTHDVSKYTKCKVFEHVGKRTPLFVRFSIVAYEKGSPDTIRDPRGFAVKFYSEDGNWDLVGNNTPTFYIRDPILFPSFVHSQKRNPQTNILDIDMIWDFVSLRPETTHQVMFVFADRGTPDGYRHMNGYGSHTFKLVNAAGEACYCKFHFKTDQKIKNLPAERARELYMLDGDHAQSDLYNSIEKGNFPSWTLCIQVMTFEEAERFPFNPFDITKVWPQADYPLIPVGKMVLNRNPKNYFAEVEQSAFSPSHMIPGIEPSPDKMLQGRLFAYPDTQIYRLGINHQQIPINCPYRARATNYQRDGPQCATDNQGGAPNYYPNSFSGPVEVPAHVESSYKVSGDVKRYNSRDDDNFTQAGIFWRKVLKEDERGRLVDNIANHLKGAQKFIQERAIGNFSQVHPEMGRRIKEKIASLTAVQMDRSKSSL